MSFRFRVVPIVVFAVCVMVLSYPLNYIVGWLAYLGGAEVNNTSTTVALTIFVVVLLVTSYLMTRLILKPGKSRDAV